VLRVEVLVVLKYSLNLVDEPEVAAVEAARARAAQLESAFVVEAR